MPLAGQLRSDALKLIQLISRSPLRIEQIVISNDATTVLRIILQNPEDISEDEPSIWKIRSELALKVWGPQLRQMSEISSELRREVLFQVAESPMAAEFFSEHIDLLVKLAHECKEMVDRERLKNLIGAPASLQGVPCGTLGELLEAASRSAQLREIDTIVNADGLNVNANIAESVAELPKLLLLADKWERLENLLRKPGMLHQLMSSKLFTAFLGVELQAQESQGQSVTFTQSLVRVFFEGQRHASEIVAPLIDVYVQALQTTVRYNEYFVLAIPLNSPHAPKFIHGLFRHGGFQRMFRGDCHWWPIGCRAYAQNLMRWSFRAIKTGVEERDVIPMAEWLDVVTTSAGIDPPHDVEDGRFIIFCMAALKNKGSSPGAAEVWFLKALSARIAAPPSGTPSVLEDLIRRLNEWWKQAQAIDQGKSRIFELLTDVGRALAAVFHVEWNLLLMPFNTRQEAANLSQLRWKDASVERLFKWHGCVAPDQFLLDMLQAIGNGKVRLPGGETNCDLQISSPWFLNRVLEVYGTPTADVAIRRGAHRVLYNLTLDEASKTQLIGRVGQLLASSEWVQRLVSGLLDTFSEATVQEVNGILETYLEPALIENDLELDDDCKKKVKKLDQRLHQFCNDHVEASQTSPSILQLLTSRS